MRKISAFLASLLVFTAVATSFGPMQSVQAFSSSEINYSDYDWNLSAKEGGNVSFYNQLDYETVSVMEDFTGWKAALCPKDNKTLEAAAVTFDITKEKIYINEERKIARLSLYVTLPADIKEGSYCKVVFDAAGNMVNDDYGNSSDYINKTLLSFNCSVMNDDGYAYAYVYSESPALNADTYPTLYAADKETAVTSFEDYTTGVSAYGDTVHYYKLKILDKSQFTFDENPATYLYYKAGTPNVSLTVSSGDVSGSDAVAVNDGGVGINPTDANGFGYLSVLDLNACVEKYGMDWEVKSPFGDSSVDSDTDSDDDDDDDEVVVESASATVGGESVGVSIGAIKDSNVPAVQAAINNVVSWVNKVSANPAEVIKVLNQYAPAMKVEKVLAAGTLELELHNNTDISAGASITFTNAEIASQVKSGDKVVVLHVKQDGSIEYVPATAGDGTITATFTSLSPVAWYKVEASGNGNAVSPKTGISFWDFLMKLFG